MSCHPQCSWLADDPITDAVCQPRCKPPVCAWMLHGGVPDIAGVCGSDAPTCFVSCPADQCEGEEAPQCETRCQPHPVHASCEIECQAMDCKWDCAKPLNAPIPTFELNCEVPQAKYDSTNSSDVANYTVLPFTQRRILNAPTPPPAKKTVDLDVLIILVLCALFVGAVLGFALRHRILWVRSRFGLVKVLEPSKMPQSK